MILKLLTGDIFKGKQIKRKWAQTSAGPMDYVQLNQASFSGSFAFTPEMLNNICFSFLYILF